MKKRSKKLLLVGVRGPIQSWAACGAGKLDRDVVAGAMMTGKGIAGLFVMLAVFGTAAKGASFQTLHTFMGADGSAPMSGPLYENGTLYGTTEYGGLGGGTVYWFALKSGKFATLHSFTSRTDGENVLAAPILRGRIVYGTAEAGGGLNGSGTVYKLNIGTRVFRSLHVFGGGSDGGSPYASLTSIGRNLYGTTFLGGASPSFGTIFEIEPKSHALTTLFSFKLDVKNGTFPDGAEPAAGLVRDSRGRLYGDATLGGTSPNCAGGCGILFEFNPATQKFKVLHDFAGSDGELPSASLVLLNGILFGTTEAGAGGYGTVFAFILSTGKLTTLHEFTGGADGANSYAPVVFDSAGNLYGTTEDRGAYGYGTVFELNPKTKTFTLLHAFTGGSDEGNPFGGLAIDASGVLYGTTSGEPIGGGQGTIFELAP